MLQEWTHLPGMRYIVTGFLYNSARRFRLTSTSPHFALNVNLWRGSVWLVNLSGQRKLVKRVWN